MVHDSSEGAPSNKIKLAVMMTKSYEGDATTRRIPGNRWKVILNQALLRMLKEFSTDLDLVEFLEK
jgi:hypothetical protein